MDESLQSVRTPSLRWRLLTLVSIASLLIVTVASSMSYRRAKHEVQELMDDQMAKTAQLILAEARHGGSSILDLPARIAGVRGLRERDGALTLEYQIGPPGGPIIARSPNAPRLPLPGALGYATLDADGQPWRSLTLESPDATLRVQIVESIPRRNAEALEIAVKTVQPLILVFPLLLLAIYGSVRGGLKPLDDLANEVATRSSDNLTPIAGRRIPREAQPLVAAINRMLYRLGFSLESERRFTADAAHELRTPLAAARIQAQVAMLSTDPAARQHALAQTVAGLDRATRLVEQMLRLARLDPLAQLPHTETIDLASFASQVAAGVQDARPEANVVVTADDPGPTIRGDVDLLESALRNLIDNAIRYSPQGSEISVFVERDQGTIRLGTRDSGPGVPDEELPRLAERFFRSTSATADGSGLGLTIVSRIAQLHNAALRLANRPEGGFEATLVF